MPPAAPLTANVVTIPLSISTDLTLLFPVSATRAVSLPGKSETQQGALKAAAVPTPSANRASPDPAKVLVAPLEIVITRITLFPVSATTTMLPLLATPDGLLNKAPLPIPSCHPLFSPTPARVRTLLLSRSRTRITWFPVSAINARACGVCVTLTSRGL